jgi:hypothetical protein
MYIQPGPTSPLAHMQPALCSVNMGSVTPRNLEQDGLCEGQGCKGGTSGK